MHAYVCYEPRDALVWFITESSFGDRFCVFTIAEERERKRESFSRALPLCPSPFAGPLVKSLCPSESEQKLSALTSHRPSVARIRHVIHVSGQVQLLASCGFRRSERELLESASSSSSGANRRTRGRIPLPRRQLKCFRVQAWGTK